MKIQFEKTGVGKSMTLIFSIGIIFLSIGCEPPAPTTNATVNANTVAVNTAVAPSNLSNTTVPNKESEAKMPVTLPVLDAMFSDESFAGELKSKIQLTDEEIQNLKKFSREAVSNLSERNAEENVGSTRAATERADRQIREILGEEKSVKLFELVRQRWANGGEEANNSSGDSSNSAKPNSIPTDTRVVVNAPAYRMDIFQEGKLLKSYKIGIGYPEFPLPSGIRKANAIIFNPTWTPPDEPWVKGKIEAGKMVAAGSEQNPLGPIKIPIGSPSLIHGGKSPARLGNFASHGCVGLTNGQVQDFAVELAKVSGLALTTADVKNYEKQKTETKNVKLDKSIPVELRYETIVVENGKLKIYRDVYERGTNTEENLRRVLDSYGVSLDSLKQQDREKILKGLTQMALDATGNAIETNASLQNNNSKTDANKNSNNSKNTNINADNGSVTRNVKGKKEVSFDLAELKGKGYPAAVGMTQ
ncbi:MAG: L,D-transpeptidase [Acidobacteria bacterium]|jgi:lipoprotein-anchoring transpeptidase ErfK/SrfK|nr:L,D-transpeptidase [Acidobacteriota bacterium]